MKKNSLWIIVVIILVIIIAVWWVMASKSTEEGNIVTNTTTTQSTTNTTEDTIDSDTNNDSNTTTTTNTTNDIDVETNVIALTTFSSASSDWYEQIWLKAADAKGEVTYGSDGVTFTGLESNSRAGIMTDLDVDVTGYSELNIHAVVTNKTQTLSGTGWNGREAPVAIIVAYTDVDGLAHKSLGLDPSAAGQMFYRGFYSVDPTGNAVSTNGVKVISGEKYKFDFDLMTLNPKPATVHYIAVEGSGWQDRVGIVHELSLVGVK